MANLVTKSEKQRKGCKDRLAATQNFSTDKFNTCTMLVEGNYERFRNKVSNFVYTNINSKCSSECARVGGIDICIEALVMAVNKGLDAKRLYCTHCMHPHLDKDECIKSHLTHLCDSCNSTFAVSPCVVGNPLASLVNLEVRKKLL